MLRNEFPKQALLLWAHQPMIGLAFYFGLLVNGLVPIGD
jgi:hypothetical protein